MQVTAVKETVWQKCWHSEQIRQHFVIGYDVLIYGVIPAA